MWRNGHFRKQAEIVNQTNNGSACVVGLKAHSEHKGYKNVHFISAFAFRKDEDELRGFALAMEQS